MGRRKIPEEVVQRHLAAARQFIQDCFGDAERPTPEDRESAARKVAIVAAEHELMREGR